MYVNVEDISDTPPRWLKYQASSELHEETQMGYEMFTIEAYDPDRNISHEISYFIDKIECDGEVLAQNEFFLEVTEDGKVLTTKPVDKEAYNSSFTIFEVRLSVLSFHSSVR